MLVAVLGIALSSSVGFGAILDVDGNITPADYDFSYTDSDIAGEPFAGTGLDIDTVHFGAVPSPLAPEWFTLGMTVANSSINTTGDGTMGPFSRTSIVVNLSQGQTTFMIQATLLAGTVQDVLMLDTSGPAPAFVPLSEPTDLRYAVGTGFEIAIKTSKFTNFSPASPFDFAILFEGGGTDRDDIISGKVPEPATMTFLALGGLAVLRKRRKK
ncbi:MAG: PEP-CTERM sorting domain-containing protein [Actinobacteria bacterium]|nr:PEP-CTERM sorting domain-containing protein [Actinomycetota bacterium]